MLSTIVLITAFLDAFRRNNMKVFLHQDCLFSFR